ncbi:hypothetical protein [Chryseobacterium oryctis]|uniref:DUF4468 domain-containing protein n=1 Tax=Chryseobacterium oryctis TaxID=2952618 RepID=A0ABT3HKF0_9FLAO|nr:hypothetical protein [Chryseobacterium oryctis]MCW3160120.1 hypothetical protein [Chryseobacterium oryctis]
MKTEISKLFIFSFLFFCFFSFAQEKGIVKLLNNAISRDLKIEVDNNYFEDKLRVVTAYKIDNDVLSVEFEVKKSVGSYVEKREVSISDILFIGKDINVIFGTKENAVKVTRTRIEDGGYKQKEESSSDLFFTGIRNMKNNETLGESLKKVFKKAGYAVELKYWYD